MNPLYIPTRLEEQGVPSELKTLFLRWLGSVCAESFGKSPEELFLLYDRWALMSAHAKGVDWRDYYKPNYAGMIFDSELSRTGRFQKRDDYLLDWHRRRREASLSDVTQGYLSPIQTPVNISSCQTLQCNEMEWTGLCINLTAEYRTMPEGDAATSIRAMFGSEVVPRCSLYYHVTTLAEAVSILCNGASFFHCRSDRDFGCGFYLFESLRDAWAYAAVQPERAVIIVYDWERDGVHLSLKPSWEWAELVSRGLASDANISCCRQEDHEDHSLCVTGVDGLYVEPCDGMYDSISGPVNQQTVDDMWPIPGAHQIAIKSLDCLHSLEASFLGMIFVPTSIPVPSEEASA